MAGELADGRSVVVGWGGAPSLVGNISRFRAFSFPIEPVRFPICGLREFFVNELI
jgi:hypothetical protein